MNGELNTEILIATIQSHERQLHALAVRMLGNHHGADDAVQDAYVRAFRSLDRFRGDSSMATWLYRITSNVCLDTIRRRRQVVFDPTEEAASRPAAGDLAESVTSRTVISNALAALPDAQRDALVLTGVIGLDYQEASAVLGIPEGTVASRLHRARNSMRRLLDIDELDAAA